MQTECIIFLMTEIYKKKCVLVKLKVKELNTYACPPFLICEKKKQITVTEKYVFNYFYPTNNNCV